MPKSMSSILYIVTATVRAVFKYPIFRSGTASESGSIHMKSAASMLSDRLQCSTFRKRLKCVQNTKNRSPQIQLKIKEARQISAIEIGDNL